MKPLIGVSTFNEKQPRSVYCSVSVRYLQSVSDAGGLAVTLPVSSPGEAEAFIVRIDGLILTGGKDTDPEFYGQEPARGLRTFDSQRDEWELALFRAALERGIPVLGICRGHQLINIALGGNVYQDLLIHRPGTNLHNPEEFPVDRPFHGISIIEGSLLHKVLGETLTRVNSFHHQAVKDLGQGLTVTALAADGVVEAIESTDPDRFILGVQFHPEGLTRISPKFLGIFSAFVNEASKPKA
ncbi:MAG: gamma-glutamyl-gamma-aminobutyrate hydrolase family protein [Spirochaetes bacterium]|nr:gamma-glutamyl-gamma-aminobutyrate hydrolase family protein [Spirochaetota bacterium]